MSNVSFHPSTSVKVSRILNFISLRPGLNLGLICILLRQGSRTLMLINVLKVILFQDFRDIPIVMNSIHNATASLKSLPLISATVLHPSFVLCRNIKRNSFW